MNHTPTKQTTQHIIQGIHTHLTQYRQVGVREVSQSTLRKEKTMMKTMMMVTEEGEAIDNMKIMKTA